LKDLQLRAGEEFEIGIPSYSAWGNLALVGVSSSTIMPLSRWKTDEESLARILSSMEWILLHRPDHQQALSFRSTSVHLRRHDRCPLARHPRLSQLCLRFRTMDRARDRQRTTDSYGDCRHGFPGSFMVSSVAAPLRGSLLINI